MCSNIFCCIGKRMIVSVIDSFPDEPKIEEDADRQDDKHGQGNPDDQSLA